MRITVPDMRVLDIAPYILVFGRHPRLAFDAFLGLHDNDHVPRGNHSGYVGKLKDRLAFAYKRASEESGVQQSRHKALYDLRVRESKLEVGGQGTGQECAFRQETEAGRQVVARPVCGQRPAQQGYSIYLWGGGWRWAGQGPS